MIIFYSVITGLTYWLFHLEKGVSMTVHCCNKPTMPSTTDINKITLYYLDYDDYDYRADA